MLRQYKSADIIIDLDSGLIEVRDKKLKKALALTSYEKDFAKTICQSIKSSDNGTFYEGSDEWLRSKFFSHAKSMFCTLALVKREILPEKTLKKFNISFLAQWAKTKNFFAWNDFHDSLLHTSNIFVSDEAEIYSGKVELGTLEGKGTSYNLGNKLIYTGNWKENYKHGFGLITSLDSSYLYEGNFSGNKKSGEGKEISKKGQYSGLFEKSFLL